MVYKFNQGRFSGDAEEAFDALETIRATHDGQLRSVDVVRTAEDKKSTLHRHFEWDDSIAAESQRRQTARSLVRSIVIVEEKQKTVNPVFINVAIENSDGKKERYYQLMEVATKDEWESAIDGLRMHIANISINVEAIKKFAKTRSQKRKAKLVGDGVELIHRAISPNPKTLAPVPA